MKRVDLKDAMKQRRVCQIMSDRPSGVAVGATLGQAVAEMERQQISCVLVNEGGTPVGILTERDVIRAFGQGNSTDTPVALIMTRELVTVRAGDEVHEAYHRMALNRIRHLVVVDDNGATVGIVTETDFRKHRGLESFVGVVSVSKAMSQDYLTLGGASSVLDGARAMQQRKVTCIVVEEGGCPQGIVTERDMVRLFRQQRVAAPLSDVMSHPVASALPDAPLVDAVRQMQAHKIRHMVVVDNAGMIVGVLSEHDTVRQLEDEYIQMLQHLVATQAQELNEDKFRAVVDQLPHGVSVKDINSTYLSCYESFAANFAVGTHEVIGKTDFDLVSAESAEQYLAEDRQVLNGATLSLEHRYLMDGKPRWMYITKSPMRDGSGEITGIVAIFYDITEKKLAETERERNAWTMSVLNAANRALLFAEDETRLLQDVCSAIVHQDRYALAWIGWADRNAGHTVTICASAGRALAYLDNLKISWADDEYGSGPTGRAIRFSHTEVNRDTHLNPAFQPWLKMAEKFNIRSSLSIPIKADDAVLGVLVAYAGEVDAFKDAEVKLFESLAENLGYGVKTRRIQNLCELQMREKTALASKLDSALEGALMAIAATLEQRDPYTAGHERNVAQLALQIGRELGMDESQLKALHLAAIVHDLGKIQIPAEILTKPGRLNAAEFALIKLHPENGYEILRNVDFPWPIAEIIRQHHEYLDGSGYPRGLAGEQILPLARILTVADIVESMSSDRPYRAALGLDQAVQTIVRMRGEKLDPDVVGACVRIVQRGEFEPARLVVDD